MQTPWDTLVAILQETRDLLAQSEESLWAPLTPAEVIAIFDRELAALQASQRFANRIELVSLFAPTAEIQEIALASGWGDYYLEVAARFDDALAACDTEGHP